MSVTSKALVGLQRPKNGPSENRGFACYRQEILSIPEDRSPRASGRVEDKH